jgi:hypothetical protein
MSDPAEKSWFKRVPLRRLLSLDVGLLDVRAFWRTRKATKAGEALYDLTPEQRESEGFMDPWLFNIQESVLALIPVVGAVKMLDFVYGDAIQALDDASPLRQYYAEIFLDTQLMLFPFVIPLALMLTAPVLAWGSFRKGDATDLKRERATHAYLYIDGAHGFLAQVFAMVGLSVTAWASATSGSDDVAVWAEVLTPAFVGVSGLMGLLMLIAAAMEFQIVMRRVPAKLFELNGYDPNLPRFFSLWWKRPNLGPVVKYTLVALVGTSIIGGLISLVGTGVASGFSWALAFAKALLLGELG